MATLCPRIHVRRAVRRRAGRRLRAAYILLSTALHWKHTPYRVADRLRASDGISATRSTSSKLHETGYVRPVVECRLYACTLERVPRNRPGVRLVESCATYLRGATGSRRKSLPTALTVPLVFDVCICLHGKQRYAFHSPFRDRAVVGGRRCSTWGMRPLVDAQDLRLLMAN